jgi:hypothetical protein
MVIPLNIDKGFFYRFGVRESNVFLKKSIARAERPGYAEISN